MYQAVLLDISGVLIQDNQALPGAVDAVAALQSQNIPFRLVTNTSRQNRHQLLEQLQELGFNLKPEQLFTAVDAVESYLDSHNLSAYCLNHPNLDAQLATYAPKASDKTPDAVVIADAAEKFDYEHLNQAFQYLMAGAELIAIGDNRYFHKNKALWLDAGPFIHGLEYAADTQALILGKPASGFFSHALKPLSIQPEQVVMVGDDAIADVDGALGAGLGGCLVKTGKYRPGDEQDLSQSDALLADNIQQALEAHVALR